MTLLGVTSKPDKDGKPIKAKHDYCASLRKIPVADVATDDVLKVIRPIWRTKAETARRIRGRIERVLDAAKAAGERTGENPADGAAIYRSCSPSPRNCSVAITRRCPTRMYPPS